MKQLLFCIFLLLLGGCSSNQPPAASGQIDELPAIYPDYTGVTVPQSIAPLNFAVQTDVHLPFMPPAEPFPFPAQTGKSYWLRQKVNRWRYLS